MKKAPPLWTWLIVLLLMGGGIAELQYNASPVRFMERNNQDLKFQINIEKLIANYYNEEDACTVLLVGSSLTAAAINSDEISRLITKSGQQIGFYKAQFPGNNPLLLPYLSGFFEACSTIQPDLVIFEDNALAKAPLNYYKKNWKKELIGRIDSDKNNKNRASTQKELAELMSNRDFDTYQRKYNREQSKDTSDYPIEYREIHKYSDNWRINKLLKASLPPQTSIVILHMPLPESIEKKVMTPQIHAEIQQLTAEYTAAGFPAEYWKFKSYFPFAYYADFNHMNHHGNQFYSAWLAEKIIQKLADQCH